MYKLIAFDCDGTLLNSKKVITERTVAAIGRAAGHGMKLVLASARPYYRLVKFIKQLGITDPDQYTIAFNGGLIVSNNESETLFSTGFTSTEVDELVRIGREYGTTMFLYYKDGIYSNADDEKYRKKNPDVRFNVSNLDICDLVDTQILKIAYVNKPDETIKLRARLPAYLNEKYEISSSVPQFIEFVSKGITKSKALSIIGKRFQIGASEMIAFGDEDNDLPMLRDVGYSIAMGNASDKVKAEADFITLSNDDDGVAIAIEKILDEMK